MFNTSLSIPNLGHLDRGYSIALSNDWRARWAGRAIRSVQAVLDRCGQPWTDITIKNVTDNAYIDIQYSKLIGAGTSTVNRKHNHRESR